MRRFEPDCGRRNLDGFEIQLNGVCFISQTPGPADCEAGFCFFAHHNTFDADCTIPKHAV